MFIRPPGKVFRPEQKGTATPVRTTVNSSQELKSAIDEFEKRNNYPGVIEHCTRAISSSGQSLSSEELAECHRLRARANVQLRKPDDECLSDYSQSILLLKSITPPSIDVQIKLIKDYIARGHAYRRLGFQKLSLEDYALAQQTVEQAIKHGVTDTSKLTLLRNLKNTILYDEAVAHCELRKKGSKENPDRNCAIAANKLLQIRDAIGLTELKRIGDASGYKVKKLVEALSENSGIELDLKKREGAFPVEMFEKVKKPLTLQTYCDHARLNARDEVNREIVYDALAYCNSAINLDPNYAEPYFIKGIVYITRLKVIIKSMEEAQDACGYACPLSNYIEATRIVAQIKTPLHKEALANWFEEVNGLVSSTIYHFEKALSIQNEGALNPEDKAKTHYYLFHIKLIMGKSTTDLMYHYDEMCRCMPQGNLQCIKDQNAVIEAVAFHLVDVSKAAKNESTIVDFIEAMNDKNTKIALLKKFLEEKNPKVAKALALSKNEQKRAMKLLQKIGGADKAPEVTVHHTREGLSATSQPASFPFFGAAREGTEQRGQALPDPAPVGPRPYRPTQPST